VTKLRINSRASRIKLAGLVMDTFEVRNLPLTELHCPVREVPTFADRLAVSIKESGLYNPIIIVRTTLEELRDYYGERGYDLRHLPKSDPVNCVWGGTNRIAAARELGYTSIDCVLIPDFYMAMRLQELQRNAYDKAESRADGTTSEVGSS